MQQHAYRIWLKCLFQDFLLFCVTAFYGLSQSSMDFVVSKFPWSPTPLFHCDVLFYVHDAIRKPHIKFLHKSKCSHKILPSARRKAKNNKNGRQCIHPFYFLFMIYVSSAHTATLPTPSRTHRHACRRRYTLLILMRIRMGLKSVASYVDWWTRNRFGARCRGEGVCFSSRSQRHKRKNGFTLASCSLDNP